ncbi:MAG: TonB-dependent receptor [Bacteroidia bacterium]|nr:TonB-dependent receptor [Bacteroidia bacterium]
MPETKRTITDPHYQSTKMPQNRLKMNKIQSYNPLCFLNYNLKIMLASKSLWVKYYPKYCLLISLLLLSQATSAQLFQTVKGRVVESNTEQVIEGATIKIVANSRTLGGYSNEQGYFRVDSIPIGRINVFISCIGYEPISLQNVELTSGKQLVINISLDPDFKQREEVVISGSENEFSPTNETISNSGVKLLVEETNKYAGAKMDPARMVQTIAGVTSVSDQRNDIIVRGGSPLGVLWRLDDIDIPNPNHFATQGATGGPISMINNNLLATSDFLTGGFPANYGNKISAVFDLKLRTGNDEKHEFVGQLGFNGFELLSEGPIQKKSRSTYLASYRYSALGFMKAIGINLGIVAIPRYQDFNFKLNFPLKNGDVISVIGLGGLSAGEVKESEDTTSFGNGRNATMQTSVGVLAANYQHFWNNNSFTKFILAATHGGFKTTVDSVGRENDLVSVTPWYSNDSREGSLQFRVLHHTKINTRNVLKAGFTNQLLSYSLNEKRFTSDFFYPIPYKQDTAGVGVLLQGFALWSYRITQNLSLNLGLYSQYLNLSQNISLEPRGGVSYWLSPKHRFSAAISLHRMAQPLTTYTFKSEKPDTNIQNINLRFTQAVHYIIGYEWFPKASWQFKIEGYYQDISKVPISPYNSPTRFGAYSLLNAGVSYGGVFTQYYLISQGKGKNYGIEISLKKNLSRNYYFLANTSLFRSLYQGQDRIWRSTSFDNKFVINILGGYEFKVNAKVSFDINVKYVLAGGRPYTPYDETLSAFMQLGIPDYEQYLAKRYPNYERFDARISSKINLKKTSIMIFFSVENIFNRKNILDEYYEYKSKQIKTQYQLGFFPVGGIRAEF